MNTIVNLLIASGIAALSLGCALIISGVLL
ncbi:hypothetical protein COAQ111491_22020 [Comamonas aquatilis]